MEYKSKSWQLPENYMGSISKDSVTEHLKLYTGYVKHFNLINTIIINAKPEPGDENLAYAKSETARRLAFEWNGIKNHEYYFEQLVGGGVSITPESKLCQKITEQFVSFELWLEAFVLCTKTRGIGWAVLWRDRETGLLINSWVDEQHLGILQNCDVLYLLDCWEHSYVQDYKATGRASYVTDYVANTNWGVVEKRFNP